MIKNKIINEIKKSKNGVSLEKFISICLYDESGYYKNVKPIGKTGDYITAPEISQLFGEILGIYIFSLFKKKYKPKLNLIELGPGNGTLFKDILRTFKKLHKVESDIDIHLVEINDILIEKQKKNLSSFNDEHINAIWYNDFEKINVSPSIIIANEFFDCFPINQYQKKNQEWSEKYVDYDSINNLFFYKNIRVEKASILNKLISYNNINLVEISKQAEDYFSKICNFIKKTKCTFIIVDYGYFDLPNNFTLQCYYNHKPSNLLDNLGKQDITSLVNFNSLIEIAKKYDLNIDTFVTQKKFLIENGILERKKIIKSKLNKDERKFFEIGCNKLINEGHMGEVFKFLILSNQVQ